MKGNVTMQFTKIQAKWYHVVIIILILLLIAWIHTCRMDKIDSELREQVRTEQQQLKMYQE